jgi:steroid 5-alpha reductase family enzyme
MIYIIIIALILAVILAVSIYDVLVLKRETNWKDCIHDILVYILGMVTMLLMKRSI